MCSIIGYAGRSAAAPVLVSGLRRMEYRGYDSVGVATWGDDGSILLRKGAGRVEEVNGRLGLDGLAGHAGMGHTRWATHGMVSDANAHPHVSSAGGVAIVHNGVIENHLELRRSLEDSGYVFASETDSEVIANLLQRYHDQTGEVRSSLLGTVSDIRGHYAFIAMFGDGTMACARHGEPLMAGLADGGLFLASDVRGFIEYTDDAVYLENGMCCMVRDGVLKVMDFGGNAVRLPATKVSREFGDLDKGNHDHYTIKEINEQPGVIRRAGASSEAQIRQVADMVRAAGHAYATGSGTSYNAALMGRRVLARFAGVRLDAVIASEMPGDTMLERGGVLLAISQSGESADVLEAVRTARRAGCTIAGVVNSVNSSLARDSDVVMRMDCGPEVGVAATKSFCAQYSIMLRLAEALAGNTGVNLDGVASAVSRVVRDSDRIREVAAQIRDITDVYVLGRGLHYPAAVEAALKIKELTYIHAEGLAGGEMKHGPLALIEKGTPVIVMNPYDSTYGDMLLGAREARARGAKIIGISDRESDAYDHWIRIPSGDEVSYSFSEVVAAQLLAYHAAVARDTDPDYPRNLAKSVTVK